MPLAAFADEISPTLSEALATLRNRGIDRVDLRSVGNVSILDLDDRQIHEIEQMLTGEGVAVAAIATPIGKVPVNTPVAAERARFQRALDIANRLSAKYIRVFTGYGPDGTWRSEADRAAWSEPVTHRVIDMDIEATHSGVTVLIENDRGTYAERPHRMLALLIDTGSSTVRTAFDAANYVLCGSASRPAFAALRTWIGCLHIKDVDHTDNTTVAGQGRCRWPEILDDLAAAPIPAYLSLEPHLQFAGPAGGFSGIEGFADAASALSALLDDHMSATEGTLR